MTIRTIVVDDEPLARERILALVKPEPDIEVVQECSDGAEAVAAVKKHSPDLLFLDIQMPGMDGFQVLRQLEREKLPLVIFVTAYDQHALKAFEVHALDYLLKPFKPARLKETLDRVRQSLSRREAGAPPQNLLEFLGKLPPAREHLTRIPVRTGDRILFVRTDQIEYLEAAGNYVVIHTAKENHVVRETLTALEEKLDPKQFLRISRSTMVSIGQIEELQPLFKGEHAVILRSGRQFAMTRGLREVQELLKFA